MDALKTGADPIAINLYLSEVERDEPGVEFQGVDERVLLQAFAESRSCPIELPKDAGAELRATVENWIRFNLQPILADRIRLREEVESIQVTLSTTKKALDTKIASMTPLTDRQRRKSRGPSKARRRWLSRGLNSKRTSKRR